MATLAKVENQFAALSPITEDGKPLHLEEAEALVLMGVKFENVGPWLDRLSTMRRAVCRVEPQPPGKAPLGTAPATWLAPDVVMTNFHVAEPFWANPSRAKGVRCRFDYETPAGGVGAGPGKEYSLRTEWPAGEAATADRPHPWQGLASPENQLDFALLRLERRAAEDQAGGTVRSFLTLTARIVHSLRPDDDPPAPRGRAAEAVLRVGHRGGNHSCPIQGQYAGRIERVAVPGLRI